MANLKKATEQYDKRGGSKTVDIDFSFRRNTRAPLDESSTPKTYAILDNLLKDPTSNIYKGQIVSTYGPEGDDNLYYSPWLVKQLNSGAYFVDRVMTHSYTDLLLGSIYVKKVQLGTTYTGVGKWVDGTEDGLVRTITYSEVFNDYKNNEITSTQYTTGDDVKAYSHVEGTYNSTGSRASHVEGAHNRVFGNASYSHVEGSFNQLGRLDQNEAVRALDSAHVEGKSNIIYGEAKGAHVEGIGNLVQNGNYSHVGGTQNKIYGDNAFGHGIGLDVRDSAVAFGSYNTANSKGFAIGAYNTTGQNADWSFVNGINNQATGKASHAEGIKTEASGEYSHAEGNNTYSIGASSHSEGIKTSAMEKYSHAEGYSTNAMGESSHSEGNQTQSVAKYSHAEGFTTSTNDGADASHAEGYNTSTSGKYSHSEGNQTKAVGESSHSEGDTTTANGKASHSEGSNTTVDGNYSHAEGYGNTIDETSHYSHVEGSTNAIKGSEYSHAEGSGNNITSANYAHVEGNQNNVTSAAHYAHAEGFQTKAEGQSSHSEGNTTEAKGNTSHAEGNKTTAEGINSHSEGNNTKAIGNSSHSEGTDTTANGNFSHTSGKNTSTGANGEAANAEGIHTQANGEGSHSEGYYTTAGFVATDGTLTKANHAEGSFTYAAGSYSHSEGHMTQAYGTASKSSGLGTIVRGDYSMSHGFYSGSPNMYEISFGSYNRAYAVTDGLGAENIKKVPNEFARLGGKYVAGRYPDGIKDENNRTVAYYNDSYQSIFTIGNGSSDNKASADPLSMESYTYNGKEYYKDAGQQVKDAGRHNIMDIRKNGQMYYDGGMIVGGEIVAPMSYSYVASLGPTAYFTTIMAALLTQPEYYRPYLKKTFTGSSTNNSNFNSGNDALLTVEVGSSISLGINFTGYRLSYDSLNHLDPIYGTVLGNMLGYSTGITNITYKVSPGNASLTATQNNNTFNTNDNLCSKDYGIYENTQQIAIPSSVTSDADNMTYINNHKCGFKGNLAANINIGRSLAGGKWDYFAYQGGDSNSTKTTDTKQIVTNFKIGTEDTYTMLKTLSYEYAPASQMYFQQLAEKGTYIGAAGTKPLEKWNVKEKYTCNVNMNVRSQYIYYYGVSKKSILEIQKEHDANTVANKGWDAIVNGTAGYNLARYSGGFGYNCDVNGSTDIKNYLNKAQDGTKTLWVAVPACMFALKGVATNAKGYPVFFQYSNKTGTVELDTGITVHDELVGKNEYGGSTPLYSFLTHTKIGNCKLIYRVFAVCNNGGISVDAQSTNSISWNCRLTRKVARVADKDMTQYDTPLTQYLYTMNNGNASQDKYTK